MHLFLKILGVTGIVLGSLLGILILILLLILFVPVFYRISGTNHDGKHHIHGKGSWLFPVLTGKGSFEDGIFALRLRLFGFCVMRYPQEETPAAGKKTAGKTHQMPEAEGKKRPESGIAGSTHRKSDDAERTSAGGGAAQRTHRKPDAAQTTFPESDWDMDTDTGMEPLEESGQDGKSGDILHTLGAFLSFFQDEENKAAFRKVKKTLLRLLRVLRPRKIKGSVIFGAGDPALTAQILGMVAVIYGMIGYGIDIQPDFNGTRLDYQFEIAGHISVFSLIMPALSLWRSGQLQVLKQNFENIMNESS